MKPISIQLYTLREQAAQDFVGVLRAVADIGYSGVEPAGFHGMTPGEFRRVVEDLGMRVSSSHGPWVGPENISEAVESAGALGLDIVGGGYGPDAFADMDAIQRTADTVNGICEALRPHGLHLFLHNHYWEFEQVAGRLAYDVFAELCPDVLFEIDTYWAANFGANDPAEQVAKFASRTPLLHIKDGPLTKDSPMTAVGSGKMDVPAVIAAADPGVLRWLVVELDACATDMVEAVRQSYDYLVGAGLASGRE